MDDDCTYAVIHRVYMPVEESGWSGHYEITIEASEGAVLNEISYLSDYRRLTFSYTSKKGGRWRIYGPENEIHVEGKGAYDVYEHVEYVDDISEIRSYFNKDLKEKTYRPYLAVSKEKHRYSINEGPNCISRGVEFDDMLGTTTFAEMIDIFYTKNGNYKNLFLTRQLIRQYVVDNFEWKGIYDK